MSLSIKSADDCRWDCLSLGEVMLRLDPGFGRVRTARTFTAREGGGEYNVSRALRKVFGKRTAIVTALVDNEVGHLVEDLMMTGGVDLRHVKWVPHDGIGRSARVGLNFTEKGYGPRAALGVSDRANTAVSQLVPGDIDWHRIFEVEGVRWMHTGGIFAALSETTAEVALEAMQAAKAAGTIISYDLNYRASLWQPHGGQPAAVEVNRRLAAYVDVMIGNEEDFSAALGFEVEDLDQDISKIDPSNFKAMISDVIEAFPNFAVVATTLRNARTAGFNDWGAVLYTAGEFYEARMRENLEIYDRVGGGDGFATGMIWSFLQDKSPEEAVEIGATHGALTMSTPGDTSMVTEAEVLRAVGAKSARVVR
ncbi:MAG: sugar kinase [Acidimicrobiales bacterium]|nr:sugar kinase [Acidimicrobiales bacterium]